MDELINFYPEQPVDPIELKNVLTYIDDQPGINGKLIDPENKLYQHIYQDMVMMNAAYKCSGLNLMKLGNKNLLYVLFIPAAVAFVIAGSRVLFGMGQEDLHTQLQRTLLLDFESGFKE